MSLDYVTHTSTAHFDRLSICMSPNWCGCVSIHMFIREQTNLKHERVGAKKEADMKIVLIRLALQRHNTS